MLTFSVAWRLKRDRQTDRQTDKQTNGPSDRAKDDVIKAREITLHHGLGKQRKQCKQPREPCCPACIAVCYLVSVEGRSVGPHRPMKTEKCEDRKIRNLGFKSELTRHTLVSQLFAAESF